MSFGLLVRVYRVNLLAHAVQDRQRRHLGAHQDLRPGRHPDGVRNVDTRFDWLAQSVIERISDHPDDFQPVVASPESPA